MVIYKLVQVGGGYLLMTTCAMVEEEWASSWETTNSPGRRKRDMLPQVIEICG